MAVIMILRRTSDHCISDQQEAVGVKGSSKAIPSLPAGTMRPGTGGNRRTTYYTCMANWEALRTFN